MEKQCYASTQGGISRNYHYLDMYDKRAGKPLQCYIELSEDLRITSPYIIARRPKLMYSQTNKCTIYNFIIVKVYGHIKLLSYIRISYVAMQFAISLIRVCILTQSCKVDTIKLRYNEHVHIIYKQCACLSCLALYLNMVY